MRRRNVNIVNDYKKGILTVTAIAAKYDVSMGLVTQIAKDSGLKLRGRGKKRVPTPASKVRKILRAAQTKPLVTVGMACRATGINRFH